MPTCPRCEGRKKSFCFENRGTDYRTHTSGFRPCSTCEGTGTITDDHVQRIAAGRRMRDERVARGELMSAAAARLGMTPAELSAIEMGRTPPNAALSSGGTTEQQDGDGMSPPSA